MMAGKHFRARRLRPAVFRVGALASASLLLLAAAAPRPAATIDSGRIVPHPQQGRLVLQVDLTGDGKPEQVRVVRVLSRKAAKRGAGAIAVANPWTDDDERIGDGGTAMALTVVNSGAGAKTWLLYSDYIRLSAEATQGAPVWVAARRSTVVKDFRRDCPAIRNDVLVMTTPAGIDIALYWAGSRYVVCWPNEEP